MAAALRAHGAGAIVEGPVNRLPHRSTMSRFSHARLAAATALSSALLSAACAAQPAPTTEVPEIIQIAPNGAWTWFNDERAIRLSNGNLLVGYVRDDGNV